MIFEIEEIPVGGLDFNLLAEKEQFEIDIGGLEKQLKNLKADMKTAQDERDRVFRAIKNSKTKT